MSVSVTRVKVCGLTTPDSAELSMNAGADAIGLVFYPRSVRHVNDLVLAREIALAAGPFVTVVALLVDASTAFIETLLKTVPVNVLQFHGNETEEQCKRYGHPYIKALRMKPNMDVLAAMASFDSAQGILLDAYVSGVPGGTGKQFDWERVPLLPPKPIILAGGLTAENVGQAIATTRPYAVDVSGGVEASPGVKSAEKVRQFIDSVKCQSV